ncbi:MAG: hypothetical protein NTV70_03070 [Acidobacteria bacterium]|nr:hypothetical protein [Acidobacteriota bacterium]
MSAAKPVGLVCAGAVSQSWVTQLPGLGSWLGPVKALTAAASTRVVRSLRAGAATDNWQVMAECAGILIYAETGLEAIVRTMAECGSDWKGRAVVVCSNTVDSCVLAPLQALGAHCGTLGLIEEGPYLVEGDPAAVRLIQGLIGAHRSRLVKLPREAKLPLLAELEASLEAALPPLTGAAAHLRAAGMSAADAQTLVLAAFQRAARARLKSPHRSRRPAPTNDG